jgi:hypothetical protein
MSDIIDTSVIDERKNYVKNAISNDLYVNITGFIKSIIVIIIVMGLYVSSSSLILYACKLAQSNILPTDIHCAPYEDAKPNIPEIETNIFTTFTDPQLSMKIKFPYNEYNASNKILDMLYEYKSQSDSSFLVKYMVSIIESLINMNYSIFNKILNILNENINESVLICIAPILYLMIMPCIFLFNQIYLLYLWFSKMSWFFRKNTNLSGTGKPSWEEVTLTSPIDYGIAVWLVMIFIFVYFIGYPFLLGLIFLILSWCIFSTIAYKGEMNGKTITVETIIQDVLKYYKIPIMGFFSFFVIISAFKTMGTVPGTFSIITLALIYFGIITIDIFKPISKEQLSKVVSYQQAKKTCAFNPVAKEKHGLLSELIFGKQSGGNLTKELKNISKTYFSKKT